MAPPDASLQKALSQEAAARWHRAVGQVQMQLEVLRRFRCDKQACSDQSELSLKMEGAAGHWWTSLAGSLKWRSC